jgi:hypothetical protein
MIRFLTTLPIAAAVVLAATAPFLIGQPPALAVIEIDRPWIVKRYPGAMMEEEPLPPPSGWRLGGAMTFPFTMAASLAYLWAGAPATFKLGGTWGLHDGKGTIATNLTDYRVYGAMLYYLVPASTSGGPYVETGLDVTKASGAVLPLNWPVVPHIGFGTNGWLGTKTAWDLNFSATANGVMTLEGGLLF